MLQYLHSGITTAEELGNAITKHVLLQQAAYGEDLFKPKSHYVQHLADQLRRFKVLLSCFMHERKHQTAKAYANLRKNEEGFDKGVIEDVTYEHLRNLDRPFFRTALRDERPASPAMVSALMDAQAFPPVCTITTGVQLTANGRQVSLRDVVLYCCEGTWRVGQVYFHCCGDGIFKSCISEWQIKERHADRFLCIVCDDPAIVDVACIIESLIYSTASPGELSHVLVHPHVFKKDAKAIYKNRS